MRWHPRQEKVIFGVSAFCAAEMSSLAPQKEPLSSTCSVPLPQLALRLGFAGSQKLPEDTTALGAKLVSVFEVIAQRVAEVAPGTPTTGPSPVGRVAQFYSKEIPVLRLVTGLCEGADALAGRMFGALAAHATLGPYVTTELAAVLPFSLGAYRESRSAGFRAEFDEQAARCSYIIALDGCYEKPTPDSPRAKARRGRAYRAQAALLLRQADLIIAAADSDVEGRTGGTMETVRAALEFDLPVVFLHTRTLQVSIIEPGDDPASAFAELAVGDDDWMAALERWVTQLTADPGSDPPNASVEDDHGIALLQEYFHQPEVPRFSHPPSGGRPERRRTAGEHLWNAFTRRCEPPGERAKSDELLQPYAIWRARSTSLNYHYSGSYRGAFLLNYLLAACAVALAAVSLVLLGGAGRMEATHEPSRTQITVPEARHEPPSAVNSVDAALSHPRVLSSSGQTQRPAPAAHGLLLALLILGAAKLGIVGWIFWNTHRANHGNWNDKAVDYRYLAERLRAMLYLPRIGSFQPPAASAPQHATRAIRQSAVDWLLDALVRSASPALLTFATTERCDFDGRQYEAQILHLEPTALLASVRDGWVWEQSVYHDRTARTMERIHIFAESFGKMCNLAVIGFVAVDIALAVALLAGWVPKRWEEALHGTTPWLVFFAALLPAVVASLNGIRFQSECQRLAERSAIMRTILRGRDPSPAPSVTGWSRQIASFFRSILLLWPKEASAVPPPSQRQGRWAAANRLAQRIASATANPATDPGSWTPEVLRLTESVAEVFVEEVAGWSVLYAKELPEP